VKYSSSGSFFTPLKGSSVCVGRSLTSSAISLSLTAMVDPPRSTQLFAQSDPLRSRLRLSFRGLVDALGHLPHVGHRDLAASEAADEPEDGRPVGSRVHRCAYLGGEDPARVRRAEREVAVDDAHRLEPPERRRQLLGGERPEPAHAHEADLLPLLAHLT